MISAAREAIAQGTAEVSKLTQKNGEADVYFISSPIGPAYVAKGTSRDDSGEYSPVEGIFAVARPGEPQVSIRRVTPINSEGQMKAYPSLEFIHAGKVCKNLGFGGNGNPDGGGSPYPEPIFSEDGKFEEVFKEKIKGARQNYSE